MHIGLGILTNTCPVHFVAEVTLVTGLSPSIFSKLATLACDLHSGPLRAPKTVNTPSDYDVTVADELQSWLGTSSEARNQN